MDRSKLALELVSIADDVMAGGRRLLSSFTRRYYEIGTQNRLHYYITKNTGFSSPFRVDDLHQEEKNLLREAVQVDDELSRLPKIFVRYSEVEFQVNPATKALWGSIECMVSASDGLASVEDLLKKIGFKKKEAKTKALAAED